jgi:hypothetical protein
MLGKRDHGLRRARSLGLAAVRIQVALTAVAINLKKLVRFTALPAAAATAIVAVCRPLWQRLRAQDTRLPRRRRAEQQVGPITRWMTDAYAAHGAF